MRPASDDGRVTSSPILGHLMSTILSQIKANPEPRLVNFIQAIRRDGTSQRSEPGVLPILKREALPFSCVISRQTPIRPDPASGWRGNGGLG